MNSTIALIINLPILLLLYLMIFFTQSLSGKRQFYGVSLNSDYFNMKEFKALDKKFKSLITLGFLVFTLIILISIYKFKNYEFTSIFSILGFCIYEFIVFIYVHNKVKTLKQNLSLQINDLELKKTKIILDTDFINEKDRIIKKYSIYYLIPYLITLLVSIYVISQYNSISDIIPTHWGANGVADAYSKKSILSVFGNILISVGIGIIIYISSIQSLKSRAKLNTEDIAKSKNSHLYYLNKFAITFLILNISCQILFIAILIATVNASNMNIYVIWPTTIVIILSSIYQTYLYYKSPNKSKNAVYCVDDDDDNWILGTFYNNPNDPSLFVQKRFGVGWTINIGSKKGKILFFSPLLILVFVVIVALNM